MNKCEDFYTKAIKLETDHGFTIHTAFTTVKDGINYSTPYRHLKLHKISLQDLEPQTRSVGPHPALSPV